MRPAKNRKITPLLVGLTTAVLLSPAFALAGSLEHELVVHPDQIQLEPGPDGLRVSLPGYEPTAPPGTPALPTRLVRLALPADADLTRLEVSVEDLRPPVRLDLPDEPLAQGRRLRWLCRQDCPRPPVTRALPQEQTGLALVGTGRSGPVPVVELLHRPVQPGADGASLIVHRHQRVRITFPSSPAAASSGTARLARTLVDNPEVLPLPAPGDPVGGLAIITTQDLVASSQALADYVTAREEQGYTVHLVTEADYGPDEPGHARALAIRAWLQAHAAALELRYVLLLGNPDPIHGDVPMMDTWPYGPEGWDYLEFVPTDNFYADLTGDWDLDGDGYYGEYGDDGGAGGVDFLPELYVGRIPVYGNMHVADGLLNRAIDYSRAKAGTGWRRRILFPASILFFENQDGPGNPRMDGADIADLMKAETVEAGFDALTMYEHGGSSPSTYPDDRPLTEEDLIAEWNKGYGIVFWFGHGSEDGAFRTIWVADRDDNHIPTYDEMSSPAYAQSIHYDRLPADTPAFVFHGSCSNGTPENAANIAYTQLKTGAIASFSSTRVALGGGGRGWEPDTNEAGIFTVGYFVVSKLRMGQSAGQALATTHALLGDAWYGAYAWHTKLATVLYGDPTLGLTNCATDVECDDGLSCNGQERCLEGICADGEPVVCDEQADACALSECTEPDGTCQTTMLDGESCDDGLFCTVADTCTADGCQGTARTCAPEADACLVGVCDEDARACATERKPDGTACPLAEGTGDGACLAGVCQPKRDPECGCAATTGAHRFSLGLLGLLLLGMAIRRRLLGYQFSAQISK